MSAIREKNEKKDAQKELKQKVDAFFEEHPSADDLVTPADAAISMGVTIRTLYNYRSKMDSYGNETAGLADDYSFKTVIDELYTRLESRIIQWMAKDPQKRSTAAALILNRHFGYREDNSKKMSNNFNGPTQIKISMPDEMKRLAR